MGGLPNLSRITSIEASALALIGLLLPVELLAQESGGSNFFDRVSVDELLMSFSFYVAPVLLIIHRILLVGKVKRSMFADSENPQFDAPEILSSPEKPTATLPAIIEFNAQTETEGLQDLRKHFISRAARHLNHRFLIGLVASLAYIAVPAALAEIAGEAYKKTWDAMIPMVVLYFSLVCIGYFVGRAEYRASSGTFSFSLPEVGLIKFVFRLIARPQSEFYVFVFFALLFSGVSNPSMPFEETTAVATPLAANSFAYHWGVHLVIAMHFLALLKRRSVALDTSNTKLLILRVFGKAGSSRFTFGRVIRFWRKFGVHFTIDDPGFAKYRFRFFQWSTLFKIVFLFMASAVGSVAHEMGSHGAIAGLIPFVAVAILAGIDWRNLLKDLPVDSRKQVRECIEKVVSKPAKPNGDFRHLRMVCYMNTWKMVVDEYIRHADVVLMDLREFNAERGGSSYEVDYLFDTFPIQKIVFLRDEESDVTAIHELINDRWKEIREGSPNLNLPEPEILLFVADKKDGQDVQALIDLLLLTGCPVTDDEQITR